MEPRRSFVGRHRGAISRAVLYPVVIFLAVAAVVAGLALALRLKEVSALEEIHRNKIRTYR